MASAVCSVYVLPGEGGRTTKESMLSVFLGRSYSAINPADWIKCFNLWNENTKGWLLATDMLTSSQVKVVGNPGLDIYKRGSYQTLVKKRAECAPNSCGLIAGDIANDLYSSDDQNSQGNNWQEALPLRFNRSPWLAGIGISLRDNFRAMRSVEFRYYMSFLRCNDPYVDRIIQRADRA